MPRRDAAVAAELRSPSRHGTRPEPIPGGTSGWWRIGVFDLLMLSGLAVAILWSAGLARFADTIPDRVVDSATPTDAIVVLTGGSERLATGLQLLAADKAQRALVSGVHPGVAVADLLRLAGAAQRSIETRVDAGYRARDTAGNAAETANWMQERGFRSLRLVTGYYHMPRSLFEIQCALPDARVIPHPVFPQVVHQGPWWSRPGTAALIISEYNKYLLSSLRHRLGGALRGCG